MEVLSMETNEIRAVQRIGEGLPVWIEAVENELRFYQSQNREVIWGVLPLMNSAGQWDSLYEGTLEVFEKSHPMSADRIHTLGWKGVLDKPCDQVRLVINQDGLNNPYAQTGWESSRITIVHRPTLQLEPGTAVWNLVHSLPCHEVRHYHLNEQNQWQREVPEGLRAFPTQDGQTVVSKQVDHPDRYARMSARIGKVALAFGYSKTGSSQRITRKDISAFQMQPEN
jgi:hypothetical protein